MKPGALMDGDGSAVGSFEAEGKGSGVGERVGSGDEEGEDLGVAEGEGSGDAEGDAVGIGSMHMASVSSSDSLSETMPNIVS